MPKDKVMHPPKESGRGSGVKQAKSSIIEGPTASVSNLTPYNRSGSNKKR